MNVYATFKQFSYDGVWKLNTHKIFSEFQATDGVIYVENYTRVPCIFGVTENWLSDLRSWCLTWRTTKHTYPSFSLTRNGDELELAVFFFTTSSRWLVCLFTQNSTTTFDFCLNLNGQFLWVTPGSAESFWELLKQDFYRPSGLSVAIPTTSEQWRANSVLWC